MRYDEIDEILESDEKIEEMESYYQDFHVTLSKFFKDTKKGKTTLEIAAPVKVGPITLPGDKYTLYGPEIKETGEREFIFSVSGEYVTYLSDGSSISVSHQDGNPEYWGCVKFDGENAGPFGYILDNPEAMEFLIGTTERFKSEEFRPVKTSTTKRFHL